jgi:bifunctional ADP-heptose synthase (sugar kinase/adenylyltransferase)
MYNYHLIFISSNITQGPVPNSRVVYIDGAFDLFHAGHVEVVFLIFLLSVYAL